MAVIDISKYQLSRPAAKATSRSENPLAFLQKDFKLFTSTLADKKKEAFYLETSILLTAGVDLKTALELFAEEQTSIKDRQLFERIKNEVVEGSGLSEAVGRTKRFTTYEYFSIQIGEESGKLPVILKELAEYYQKKMKQRRQIIQALTYPAIVLCTSVGAILFMLNFIVPMFEDVFKRFGGDLPYMTKMILHASHTLSKYGYVWLLLVMALFLFLQRERKKDWFRKVSSKLVLKTPLLGEIVRKVYLARFSHAMTLLMTSRIPLLRATSLIKQMIGFYPIEVALAQVEKDMLEGEFLHKSLAHFPVFPKRMLSLIKVGEEVNQLETFFDKIAKQYSDEVEHQTSLIGSLIEPFMIVFLGLMVGMILIAMYLPLFQLSTVF